jgi:putative ABC transport system permease protein
MPGVTTAGFLSRVPMSPALTSSETSVAGDPTRTLRAVIQSASPGALPAIGARFVSGGDLPEAISEEPSVVINDELARVLFPAQNAVDRRVTFTFMGGTKTARVAGVIRAVRYNGLSGELLPMITIDYRLFQFPMFLVARAGTDRNAETLLPELRALVRGADATHQVTVARLTTLDREVARVLAQPRFFATVMGGFSIVVVAISAAGIFGLLSFWVSQRRRELGIRLALGAPSRSLLIGVASRAVVTVGVGIAAGAALAVVVTRSMTSLLFEVGPADPISFAVCSVLFVAAAIVAAAVPARRAGRLDPLTVLRIE